ncbi:TetR/AcrR family transcriptional regulator [Paenibacillus sp. GCM10027627]|uniref:TetR/AcrR family transcriptional regulator n=1 Tax=unclassified Paenibacillus TaxID=185978 RepID=UPI003625CFAE
METKAYSDIKMTEIAKKSGFARQTIYRHYQDKDDILYEYLCHQYHFFDDELSEGPLDKGLNAGAIGEDVFVSFFQKWQQYMTEPLLYNIHLADRKIRQMIYRSLEYYIQNKYADFFMTPEPLKSEHFTYAFRSLASLMHSLLIEWTLQRFKQTPEEMGKLAFRLTESVRGYCAEISVERPLNGRSS